MLFSLNLYLTGGSTYVATNIKFCWVSSYHLNMTVLFCTHLLPTYQGSATVGVKSRTHAVLVALKRSTSELSSYQKKIYPVDDHVGVSIAGLTADGRLLWSVGKGGIVRGKRDSIILLLLPLPPPLPSFPLPSPLPFPPLLSSHPPQASS